jgi:beta-glucanase (GH16 family)
MRNAKPLVAALMLSLVAWQVSAATTVLYDEFTDQALNPIVWMIPTWTGPSDGTYVGRTQFRCSQNSPLPEIANGNVRIRLETYNPTGFSFYGTDLILIQRLMPNMSITFMAKMLATTGGLTGGLFLYDSGTNGVHQEIDFEMLTNIPGQVQTNVYVNEPLGTGHPILHPYASGTCNDYHTYQIDWFTDHVSWFVDGVQVRTLTAPAAIPTGPMQLHLNLWAPGPEWAAAYNAALQPVGQASANQSFYMLVDSVKIEGQGSSAQPPTVGSLFASPNPVPVGQAVTFSGSATNADTLSWDFGDGQGASGTTVSHAYSSPGDYSATLVAGNSSGSASGSVTVSVYVPGSQPPNPNPSPPTLEVLYLGSWVKYRWGSRADDLSFQARSPEGLDHDNFTVAVGQNQFSVVDGELQGCLRRSRVYAYLSADTGIFGFFLDNVSLGSLRASRPSSWLTAQDKNVDIPVVIRSNSKTFSATITARQSFYRLYSAYYFGEYSY